MEMFKIGASLILGSVDGYSFSYFLLLNRTRGEKLRTEKKYKKIKRNNNKKKKRKKKKRTLNLFGTRK